MKLYASFPDPIILHAYLQYKALSQDYHFFTHAYTPVCQWPCMCVCTCLSVCLSICMSIRLSVCVCVSVCVFFKIKEIIFYDDVFFWKWRIPRISFVYVSFFLQYLWKKKKRKNERKKEEKFKKSLFVCFLLIFWCLISKFYFLFYLFGFEWLSARQKVNLRSYNCSLFLL